MTPSNTTQGAKRITPLQVAAALLTLPLHRQLEVAENLEVRGGLSTDLHNVDLCKEILRRVVAADKIQQLKEYLALVSSPDHPTAPASPSPHNPYEAAKERAFTRVDGEACEAADKLGSPSPATEETKGEFLTEMELIRLSEIFRAAIERESSPIFRGRVRALVEKVNRLLP